MSDSISRRVYPPVIKIQQSQTAALDRAAQQPATGRFRKVIPQMGNSLLLFIAAVCFLIECIVLGLFQLIFAIVTFVILLWFAGVALLTGRFLHQIKLS